MLCTLHKYSHQESDTDTIGNVYPTGLPYKFILVWLATPTSPDGQSPPLSGLVGHMARIFDCRVGELSSDQLTTKQDASVYWPPSILFAS